jgi:gluconolactonase
MRHCPAIVALLFATPLLAEEPIFEPDAKLKVEAAGGAGGEGPAWHPELGVLSSGNNHVFQLTRDGKSRIYRKDAGTNGLLFDPKGRLLACDSEGRRDGPLRAGWLGDGAHRSLRREAL